MASEKSSVQRTQSKKTGVIVGVVAAIGITAAAFAGAGSSFTLPGAKPILALTPVSTAPIFAPPPGAPLSFADIFDRVSPAVVSIDVTASVSRAQNPFSGIPGFPFGGAPGGPGGQGGQGGRGGEDAPQTREAMSSGSGFFISADGYIVTNNHVIENAREINVVLKDKRELKARVVGTDEATDLAVLKVEGRDFPFVNFENTAVPRVGDWVITIGNPFGLGGTATAGIVSAYGRNLQDESSTFVDYLQIDAPINRGNSGGPTFDVYGRVIGVNSAIFSPSSAGGSVGIGFAIPADVADNISKQLISGGKVTRGYLGATVQPFTEEMAESLGLPARKDGGAYVLQVQDDGPAATAGLQAGDIVVSLNGKAVADSTALTRMVASSRSGDQLRLDILREGRPRTVTVKSGLRPSLQELAQSSTGRRPGETPAPETPEAAQPTVLGLTLGEIDEAARRRFNIAAGVRGVVITNVTQGSRAARSLTRGDVVVLANGAPVATPAALIAAVEAQRRAKRPSILLQVNRGGRPVAAVVDLTETPTGAGEG